MLNKTQTETGMVSGSPSVVAPDENRVAGPDKHKSGFWRTELKPFWDSVRSPLFYLSLLIALVALTAAYQLPFTKNINLDAPGDRVYLSDYYSREEYKGFVYRWTKPDSNVKLPGIGQPPSIKVRLELSPRPADAPNPEIKFYANNDLFRTLQLDPTNRQIYESIYYPPNRPILSLPKGDFDLWMSMPFWLAKGDNRPFGVVVSQIQISGSGIFETRRPTIPPWGTLGLLLGSVAIVGITARRAGWGSRGAALAMLGITALLVAGLVADRALIGLGAPVLLVSVAMAYFFMMTGLLFTGWWLGRRGMLLSVQQARWLGLVFVVAFTVKAAGINHPSFQPLDHGFRIHETYALLNDPGLIVSRYYNINSFSSIGEGSNGEVRSVAAGQWEVAVAIPYSPFFYLSDFPLAQLLRDNEKGFLFWTNIYALWWEASAIFLLYIIARLAFGKLGNTSGLIAGVLFGFFPLTFLQPSDGGYPSMQAQWLSLFFVMLLVGWIYQRQAEPKPLGWRSIVGGGLMLGLALLSHTATLLLMSGFMGLLIIFLSLWGGRYRYLNRPLLAVFGVGLALSFGLYYGFYVGPLLTRTLPTLAGKVGQGENVGARSQTLNGFWDELLAHFHLFPFFITLAVLGYLVYAHWRGPRLPIRPDNSQSEVAVASEISRPIMLMLIAWFSTFLLFSIIASRINLLHKHMLFAIPLFALGCGLALALLLEAARRWQSRQPVADSSRRGLPRLVLFATQGAMVALVFYFILIGATLWFQRVINYVLPAGTG